MSYRKKPPERTPRGQDHGAPPGPEKPASRTGNPPRRRARPTRPNPRVADLRSTPHTSPPSRSYSASRRNKEEMR